MTKPRLTGYLVEQGGVAPAAEVMKAARADGIPERTLKRARHRARVTSERRGFGKGAMWSYDPSGSFGPPTGPFGPGSESGPEWPECGPNGPEGETTKGDQSWLPTSAATGATPHPDRQLPAEPTTGNASPSTVSASPAVAASPRPDSPSTSCDTAALDLLSSELGATPINPDAWQHMANGYDT